MHILLSLTLPPIVGILLAWTGVRRFVGEPGHRGLRALIGVGALAAWAALSWALHLVNLGVAMGIAHSNPPRAGAFPEGWLISLLPPSMPWSGPGW